jgi:hypothetical protein
LESLKKYLYQRKVKQGQARKPGGQDIRVKFAKKIGIIFDATQIDDREKVLEFKAHLRDQGYQVRLLGFVNEKVESISFPFDYYSLKEVRFNYVPEGNNIDVFVAESYDILINLDFSGFLSLHYIAAVVDAKLKVGVPSEGHDHYDLMFEVDNQNQLQDFIREMRNTLNKIH